MTDKNKLYYFGRFISDLEFAKAKNYAYSDGMVLENDALSIFAFDVAHTFYIDRGLADIETLETVQTTLDSLLRVDISGLDKDGKSADKEHAVITGSPDLPGSEQTEETFYPMAIGAFDFLPNAPTKLYIPKVTFIKKANNRPIVIVVSPTDDLIDIYRELSDYFKAKAPTKERLCPDEFHLSTSFSHENFLSTVKDGLDLIKNNVLTKIVLAREVTVTANRAFNRRVILERLRTLHPTCLTFAIDGFVGASPELLIQRDGDQIISSPLAGTVARSGTIDEDKRLADDLATSEKNLAEHGYVVKDIIEKLSGFCKTQPSHPYPEPLFLRNVTHLKSTISAQLKAPYPSVLRLVSILHPTPAVAGIPQKQALEAIERLENLTRGYYSAPIGFVRKGGDGEFYLGIRSAKIEKNKATLIAGVGIVKDSNPADELTETQLKLQALLAAIVRP